MAICANCGAELPPRFRFCGACGAPVPEAVGHDVRKVVTVLFCDVADSTGHGERLDPERMRNVLGRYFEEIEHVIVSHGGLVEKFVGDAVMAVFGLPAAHDDDALRAVRAAVEIRERLPALAEETGLSLAFRTGVNTGEVVAGNGQTLVTGDAVNVAARIQQAADPGDVVLGEATVRVLGALAEVEPLFPLPLRGKSEPVPAYRFIRLVTPAAKARAVFVGRERELALLQDTFRRASEERELHLVTLLGSAGNGKSRLAAEFLEALSDEGRIARGRCLSYGEGITFWPLVEILRALGEPAQTALERVISGGATSPQELAWTVQRALEQAAESRPLVVVLEDLHWAEDALLDLVDSVCELSRSAPILILVVARPELLERRSTWGGGKLNATSLLLEPLSTAESERLLDWLGEALEPRQRQRVLEVACGNPLFLEELSEFVAEGGGDGDLPPRISALLQARLDLLAEPERQLLSVAAIEGTVFHRGSLERLVDADIRPELALLLSALTRKCLIRPTLAEVEGEEGFGFRHELTRDAAYATLSKGERARLHERFADWARERAPHREELEEIGAYHLERAALYRRELGEAEPGLEARAASALGAAAERAWGRSDMGGAANLWGRLTALDPYSPHVPVLEVKLATAMTLLGQFDEARRLLDHAEGQAPDPGVAANARLVRLWVRLRSAPAGITEATRRECEQDIVLFEQHGDHGGLALAWYLLGQAEMSELRVEAAAQAWARAAAQADLAGNRAFEMLVRSEGTQRVGQERLPWSVLLGDLEGLAAHYAGEPACQLTLILNRAFAAYMTGRLEQGRTLAREGLEMSRATGVAWHTAIHTAAFGRAELLNGGGSDEAERLALDGIRELRELGEQSWLSYALVLLADIRIAQGRGVEALELVDEGEELGRDDRKTLIHAESVRARAHAALGAIEAAKDAAVTSVELAEATDSLLVRALATEALAEVLYAAGELAGALTAARDSFRLFVSLEHSTRRVAALTEQIENELARTGTPATVV